MDRLNLIYHGIVYSKKNSKNIVTNQRTGKPMITSNANAKRQEMVMGWDFHNQAKSRGWEMDDEKTSDLQFSVEIKIWAKDRRRRDLDNQATAILDALVAGGVLPDDSVDFVPELKVQYMGIDRDDPRAEIEIRATVWME